MKRIKTIFAVACALGACALSVNAPDAHAFPTKPLRLVVPFPAGGSTDFIARLYADHLARQLGSPAVIVENKPGAATNLALEQFARSDPDGHTLAIALSQTVINVVFGPAPSFDPLQAFAPVALIADTAFVLAASPDSSIASLKDLVAKSQTARLTIAHAQFEPQIEFLLQTTGAKIDSIPFKGGAASVTAALGGQVTLVGGYMPVVIAQVKAGKLRGLAVSSPARVGALPDVPTFAEQGFPRFTTAMWVSVLAPKGTPEPILQRLTAASLAIAKDPQFGKLLHNAGAEPLAGNPQEVIATMRRELELWSQVRKAGK